MGLKNGWLREKSTGDMVLFSNGVEVMRGSHASTSPEIGFLGATPAAQQTHITDATDTSATDQKAPVNSGLAVDETFGLVATG